jgi:hypothetical protein
MNIICLPGYPCSKAVYAMTKSNGVFRPLLRREDDVYIGLAIMCGDNEAVVLDHCPFCGNRLYNPGPKNCQNGLTKTEGGENAAG